MANKLKNSLSVDNVCQLMALEIVMSTVWKVALELFLAKVKTDKFAEIVNNVKSKIDIQGTSLAQFEQLINLIDGVAPDEVSDRSIERDTSIADQYDKSETCNDYFTASFADYLPEISCKLDNIDETYISDANVENYDASK
jgi:hypothetical protein